MIYILEGYSDYNSLGNRTIFVTESKEEVEEAKRLIRKKYNDLRCGLLIRKINPEYAYIKAIRKEVPE